MFEYGDACLCNEQTCVCVGIRMIPDRTLYDPMPGFL